MAKRRAPGDGALFKRASDGLWVGSVEIASADGKRRQKRVTAKDYRTAKLKLDELRHAIASGMVPIARTTTTARWLNHWLTTHKKPHVRQSTYESILPGCHRMAISSAAPVPPRKSACLPPSMSRSVAVDGPPAF